MGFGQLFFDINHFFDQLIFDTVKLSLIKDVMLPHVRDKKPRGWIFQQDNDPKHRASSIKYFFNSKKIPLLDWPSQRPDLNPTEHFWEQLDHQLKSEKPTNKNDLFKMLSDCKAYIPIDVLSNLIESMPRCCQAVLKSRGYLTKY